MSPFEADPAVKALRAWAAQGARAINAGKFNTPGLDALMTATFAKSMTHIFGGEKGHYYPGPVPFTPVRVTVRSASERDVDLCFVAGGYSQHPKTHKTWSHFKELPSAAAAVLAHGTWLVSKFETGPFSCKGVHIPEPSWGG
ncbi:MAG TPA: hypothetical protein VFT67_16915 [Jatrophihabitantaceae bacterium]|nr:hypothetical protein [Jatrophihabitantaceae bacterium]